jgi:hypothetical protein
VTDVTLLFTMSLHNGNDPNIPCIGQPASFVALMREHFTDPLGSNWFKPGEC